MTDLSEIEPLEITDDREYTAMVVAIVSIRYVKTKISYQHKQGLYALVDTTSPDTTPYFLVELERATRLSSWNNGERFRLILTKDLLKYYSVASKRANNRKCNCPKLNIELRDAYTGKLDSSSRFFWVGGSNLPINHNELRVIKIAVKQYSKTIMGG